MSPVATVRPWRAAVLTLLVSACTGLAAAAEEPMFVDMEGKQVHASDHRGEVLLVSFWATWCGPCRREMPLLVRLSDELGPKGLHVIGAAADGRSDVEKVRAVVRDNKLDYEIWLWVTAGDMAYYGVGPGIPATVVIDRSGEVRRAFRGLVDEDQLRPVLEELLAEKAGTGG